MKTLRYAMLMLALALFAPPILLAQGGPPPGETSAAGRHMPSVEEQLENMSHRLSLTEAQKPQVKTILQDQRDQMKQVMDNSSGSTDENRAKMREIHEKSAARIRAVLTAEQKAKFDKMQEHREHPGEGHEGAPPPPQN